VIEFGQAKPPGREEAVVALDSSVIADLVTEITTAVSRTADEVSEDIYKLILREIPQLDQDKPLLTLLASSVDSNVVTCLQIMQHRIDLDAVRAPASALEYARRLAQHGTPLTALLRAYRIGHSRFSEWLLMELARHTDDAEMVAETVRSVTGSVAGYIDQISEEMVTAYTQERESWLRNRSAARAARIRDLLSGARIDVNVTEATLGYRLRQYHVGVVCWTDNSGTDYAVGTSDEIIRLERAISHIAAQTSSGGTPVFLPRDESSAWAWLPLGIRDRFDATSAAASAGPGPGIHVAFGDAAKGADGFRLTHLQAIAAQTVALASGSPPPAVSYSEVAPVAMMLGSADLLRAWVLSTLAGLATDDEHHARLRDTLLVFLQSGGSYKTTAEKLVLHKNTVQYRIRKAEESLGRPVAPDSHHVELALRASHWLGSSVLQPATRLPGQGLSWLSTGGPQAVPGR